MICLDVDRTNPGQFFGCCGVFELAHRLWPRATAHFEGAQFVVSDGDLKELVTTTAHTPIEVLEPTNQTSSALRLAEPFNLRIDWWKVERGLKTWAGRMSVDRIATSLQRDLPNTLTSGFFDDGHVIVGADGKKVEPYYFDGRRGATALPLDVGFSSDAPRLLAATIRAYNVSKLTRSAQYNPAVEYVEEGLLDETEDKDALKAYSERGFRHVPASATHGGVIAQGDIRREVTLHVAALRLLRGTTEAETTKLRAYLLGLALVAFTKPAVGYLRQGCNLVLNVDKKPELKVVFPDGRREVSRLTHDVALTFAKQAATVFGVGDSTTVKFDTKHAKDETTSDGKKGRKGRKTEKVKAE